MLLTAVMVNVTISQKSTETDYHANTYIKNIFIKNKNQLCKCFMRKKINPTPL